MSGAAEVVREFLDRLERGEASAEDRALADSLAFWASGWRARGASAPVGIEFPGGVTAPDSVFGALGVPFDRVLPAPLSEFVVPDEADQATKGSVEAAANGSHPGDRLRGQFQQMADESGRSVTVEDSLVFEPRWGKGDSPFYTNKLDKSLWHAFLHTEVPERVVAEVAPPEKWGKRGQVSEPDLAFAAKLRGLQGSWVEIVVDDLTWTQRHWLAQKISGSGVAYRPAGSFEARLLRQGSSARLFARATLESLLVEEPSAEPVAVAEVTEPDRSPVVFEEPPAPTLRRPPGRMVRRATAARLRTWAEAPFRSAGVIDAPPHNRDRRRRSGNRPYDEFVVLAEEIRGFDGQWVEVEVSDRSMSSINALAAGIKGLNLAFLPAGDYEATVQGGRLYARWRKGSRRG